MISVALLDDEQESLNQLSQYIERYAKENETNIQVACFYGASIFLEKNVNLYDIIFLDIEMPYKNGMDVAKAIRKYNENVIIIFVTNMAQYAIKGYEVQAYSFVVKPIDYLSISTLLERAIAKIDKDKQNVTIAIKSPSGLYKVDINEIRYIEINGHKVTYHIGDKTIEAWGNLKQLEEELSPFDFAKCNACYLVNIRHVLGIEGFNLKLEGEDLVISQSKKKPFMDRLTEYLNR